MPTQEELASGVIAMPLDCNRIYKMVSCGENRAFWIPQSVAMAIYATDKKEWAKRFCGDGKIIVNEFGLGSRVSKSERTIGAEMIKNVCIPLKVNRLGEYTLMQNLSK